MCVSGISASSGLQGSPPRPSLPHTIGSALPTNGNTADSARGGGSETDSSTVAGELPLRVFGHIYDASVERAPSDLGLLSSSSSANATPRVPSDLKVDISPTGLSRGEAASSATTINPSDSLRPSKLQTLPDGGLFTLKAGDLGESLIPSITELIKEDTFASKIKIQDLKDIEWASLELANIPPDDYDLLRVDYTPGSVGKGFSRLRLSISTQFRFPDFSKPVETADLDHYLGQLTTAPPTGTIPYHVGPPLAYKPDSLLHPGSGNDTGNCRLRLCIGIIIWYPRAAPRRLQ